MSHEPLKIWIAYHGDFSEFAVFGEEIDCLRYAVDRNMEVAHVDQGRSVREQIREQFAANRAMWPDAES